MQFGKTLAVALLALLLSSILNAQSSREQALIERVQPLGSVCMSGDACAAAPLSASSGPMEPEEIYNTYCMACHLTGASQAPIFGNAEAWAPRIEKGIDTLVQSVINGVVRDGAQVMTPMGLCTSCSEDEIRATVEYMVNAAQ
jgi:cytochrome c5